jgi:hypothetical protein
VVAEGVVDLLEAVEVDQQHGQQRVRPERADRVADPLVEQRPVGEPGEAVVQRPVLALGGLPAQVVDQAAALQRDAGVAGEGPQQGQVLRAEAAGAVGEQQRPDGAAGVPQLRHHRLGDPARRQRLAQPLVLDGVGAQDRAVQRPRQQGSGRCLVGHRGGPLQVPRAEGGPHPDAAAAEQGELGPVGSEQVAGLGEDRRGHQAGLLGLADHGGELVQEAQALVLLTQRGVGPVGQQQEPGRQQDGRQHERPRSPLIHTC